MLIGNNIARREVRLKLVPKQEFPRNKGKKEKLSHKKLAVAVTTRARNMKPINGEFKINQTQTKYKCKTEKGKEVIA